MRVLQIWLTRNVFVFSIHFLRQIIMPKPNYTGCIRRNSDVKRIKMTYSYQQKAGVY